MTVEWLICLEPVHIGGEDSSSRGNNNPIFRLPDRTPAIPGSSLRGALREGANESKDFEPYVTNWFGGDNESISPGSVSLGWGWPVWFPVHVLGYGNWWVSCPQWLNRFRQLSGQAPLNINVDQVYISDSTLNNQTVYLRWLKLTNVQSQDFPDVSAPDLVPGDRRIIVPDTSINLLVEMGLVRQPRIQLKNESDEKDNEEDNDKGNLVKNLFSVEGLPPGAVFFFTWTERKKLEHQNDWQAFLLQEHYLGGLWSVGYGRIKIAEIADPRTSANG